MPSALICIPMIKMMMRVLFAPPAPQEREKTPFPDACSCCMLNKVRKVACVRFKMRHFLSFRILSASRSRLCG